MSHQITTIARYTLLEAMRTRLPQLVLSAIVLLGAAGFFRPGNRGHRSARLQTVFTAATMRLTGVFITGLYVLSSVTREFKRQGPRRHARAGSATLALIPRKLTAFSLSAR